MIRPYVADWMPRPKLCVDGTARVPVEILADPDLSAEAKVLAAALSRYSPEAEPACWPENESLMKAVGVDYPSSVVRALNALESAGYIVRMSLRKYRMYGVYSGQNLLMPPEKAYRRRIIILCWRLDTLGNADLVDSPFSRRRAGGDP